MIGYPNDTSLSGWQIVAAVSSQQVCNERMRQQIKARVANARADNERAPKGTVTVPPKVDGDTVTVAVPNIPKATGIEGEGLVIYRREYLCLPDTVDPRGPKR